MPFRSSDLNLFRTHFEQRVRASAAIIQDIGVLVKSGSLHWQQQTYIGKGIPTAARGNRACATHACHILPGGVYVVHREGNPRFNSLVRGGCKPDSHGYLTEPLDLAAQSDTGRALIGSQLTAATVLPALVNLIDRKAEGNQGNQRPPGGEKTRFEHAIITAKLQARAGTPLGGLTDLAIQETRQVCKLISERLLLKDFELAQSERNNASQRGDLQELREILHLKVSVLQKPDYALDFGTLALDARRLYGLESSAVFEERSQLAEIKAFYAKP